MRADRRRHIGGMPAIAFALATLLLAVGCGARTTTHQLPEPEDLSDVAWTEAFDRLHDKISREYAFTEWKEIDWRQRKDLFRPRVATAEKSKDQRAYYLALRDYVYSIPDGHIALNDPKNGFGPDSLGLMKEEVGGGFGLTVAKLEDGSLVVDRVEPGGPADSAGIEPGAAILRWDGVAAAVALRRTSVRWATVPPATSEGAEYEQTRFLVRSPVGATRRVTFRNRGESDSTATLKASDDGMEPLSRTQQYSPMFFGRFPESMVESRTLDGGVGYIKIHGEGDLPESRPGNHEPTVEQFERAIAAFIAAGARGLIVDVRSNAGGADAMAAAFLGHFYEQRSLYEYQDWYDTTTSRMEVALPDGSDGSMKAGAGLYILPEKVLFTGPVVALVDNGCISSGEGVAMGIKRSKKGSVVGFRGTNGSFGMVLGPMVTMPGGFVVRYPAGQSLDERKTVQLDSRQGVGGVTPSLRVPRSLTNVLRAAAGHDVELEYALDSITRTTTK